MSQRTVAPPALFETMRLLLRAPGRLTREFLEGRRARYVSPLRLYPTCSLLFFLVVALVPRKGSLGLTTVTEATPGGKVHRPLTAVERLAGADARAQGAEGRGYLGRRA